MPSQKAQFSRCAYAASQFQRSARRQCLFSTSSKQQMQISPESPRFIDIPPSVQQQAVYRPWVKGLLPKQRKIFSEKPQSQHKVTPEYIMAVARPPKMDAAREQLLETNEVARYKARQAEHRRRNLLEGLVELHHQHQRLSTKQAAINARRRARNMALRDQPESKSAYLTQPTVLQSNQASQDRATDDQLRESRIAKKQRNIARMAKASNEDKEGMIRELYVNAQDFVTTDAEVEDAISTAFDSLKIFKSGASEGMNIWNFGEPKNTSQIRAELEKGGSKAVASSERNENVTKVRLQKIMEELTGGKTAQRRWAKGEKKTGKTPTYRDDYLAR